MRNKQKGHHSAAIRQITWISCYSVLAPTSSRAQFGDSLMVFCVFLSCSGHSKAYFTWPWVYTAWNTYTCHSQFSCSCCRRAIQQWWQPARSDAGPSSKGRWLEERCSCNSTAEHKRNLHSKCRSCGWELCHTCCSGGQWKNYQVKTVCVCSLWINSWQIELSALIRKGKKWYPKLYDLDVDRTRDPQIWNLMHYHCATKSGCRIWLICPLYPTTYIQWGPNKWDSIWVGFSCKWDSLDGTKVYNPILHTTHK